MNLAAVNEVKELEESLALVGRYIPRTCTCRFVLCVCVFAVHGVTAAVPLA